MRVLWSDYKRFKHISKTNGMSFWQILLNPSIWAIVIFRLSSYFYRKKLVIISNILFGLNYVLFKIEIKPDVRIGEGFYLKRPTGVVIGSSTIIGEKVVIYQGVTLGRSGFTESSPPIVEDNVIIEPGAQIIGNLTIGQDSIIKANSVVTKSVSPNTIALGVPALTYKKLKRNNYKGSKQEIHSIKIGLRRTLQLIKSDLHRRAEADKKKYSLRYLLTLPLNPPLLTVIIYRISSFLWNIKLKIFACPFYLFNYIGFGVDIHPSATIGERFYIAHPQGIAIGPDAVLGNNVVIFSHTAIDTESSVTKEGLSAPVLGDNLVIGVGAKILGDLFIANNSSLAAQTLLTKSVEKPNSSLIGVPAEEIISIKLEERKSIKVPKRSASKQPVRQTIKELKELIISDAAKRAESDQKILSMPYLLRSIIFTPLLPHVLARVQYYFWSNKKYLLCRIIFQFNLMVFGVEIQPGALIGKRFRLAHCYGVQIGGNCVIGDDVTIFQNVLLGGRGNRKGFPVLRNNVRVYPGAKIIGSVWIEDKAQIGAGALLLHSVQSRSLAVGVPAKIVKIY